MAKTVETFSFQMTLKDVDQVTAEMADALRKAGCGDCSLSNGGGVVTLHIVREDESFGDAVGSTIKSVERAGFKVSSVVEDTAGFSSTRVRIAGRMNPLPDSVRRFQLALADGNSVAVEVEGKIGDQAIVGLCGQDVVAAGRGVFDASGTFLRVEADYLGEALPSDLSLWSEVPRPLGDDIDLKALRRPQMSESGIAAIFGQWPGDETDEEIEAYLEEIS